MTPPKAPVTLRWRRRLARHRRPVVAGLAGLGTWIAVTTVLPAATGTAARDVLVVTRDLPAGALLAEADLRVQPWPGALVPDHALTSPGAALGRVTAGPVTAGEPLTDVRTRPRGSTDGVLAGRVKVVVGLADPAAAALATVGATVDVYLPVAESSGAGRPPSAPLAADSAGVRDVIGEPTGGAVPGVSALWPDASSPAVLILAVTPAQARVLSAVSGSGVAISTPVDR